MPRPTIDYSLYLVTDSGLLPSGRSLLEQVERAIKGGVTIVQLREKKLSFEEFVKLGTYNHTLLKDWPRWYHADAAKGGNFMKLRRNTMSR